VINAARVGEQSAVVWKVVPQAGVSHPLKVRRIDRPAKSAACAEPDIVGQDDDDIRRACRRFEAFWKIRGRILCGASNLAFERLCGSGQHNLSGRVLTRRLAS
jgi:hypothetical protein